MDSRISGKRMLLQKNTEFGKETEKNARDKAKNALDRSNGFILITTTDAGVELTGSSAPGEIIRYAEVMFDWAENSMSLEKDAAEESHMPKEIFKNNLAKTLLFFKERTAKLIQAGLKIIKTN